MRRMRRRRGERGAAAVEFALVLPLVVLLVFGMIEMAFVAKDKVAVTSSARVGARIASAAPNAGAAICDGDVPCAPGTTPRFAQLAADAMQTNGSALDTKQVDDIWIYQANTAGWPGTASNQAAAEAAGCQTNCVWFRWSEARKAFRYAGGNWSSAATNACSTRGQRVGVLLRTTHPWITGFRIPGLGSDVFIDDNAVMSFEPLTIETKC